MESSGKNYHAWLSRAFDEADQRYREFRNSFWICCVLMAAASCGIAFLPGWFPSVIKNGLYCVFAVVVIIAADHYSHAASDRERYTSSRTNREELLDRIINRRSYALYLRAFSTEHTILKPESVGGELYFHDVRSEESESCIVQYVSERIPVFSLSNKDNFRPVRGNQSIACPNELWFDFFCCYALHAEMIIINVGGFTLGSLMQELTFLVDSDLASRVVMFASKEDQAKLGSAAPILLGKSYLIVTKNPSNPKGLNSINLRQNATLISILDKALLLRERQVALRFNNEEVVSQRKRNAILDQLYNGDNLLELQLKSLSFYSNWVITSTVPGSESISTLDN